MNTLPQGNPLRTTLLGTGQRGTPGVVPIIILLAILACVISASLLRAQGPADAETLRHCDPLLAAYEFRGGQLRGSASWRADSRRASDTDPLRRDGLRPRVKAARRIGRS